LEDVNDIQSGQASVLNQALQVLTSSAARVGGAKVYEMFPGSGLTEGDLKQRYTFGHTSVPFCTNPPTPVQLVYKLMIDRVRELYHPPEEFLNRSFLVSCAYKQNEGVGPHWDDDFVPNKNLPIIVSLSVGGDAAFWVGSGKDRPSITLRHGHLCIFHLKNRHEVGRCTAPRVNFTLRFLGNEAQIFGKKWN
jgi:hypothetical protein